MAEMRNLIVLRAATVPLSICLTEAFAILALVADQFVMEAPHVHKIPIILPLNQKD